MRREADGTLSPPPSGLRVYVTLRSEWTRVTELRYTDAEGRFSGTFDYGRTAEVWAYRNEDATYLRAESARQPLTGRPVPTRINFHAPYGSRLVGDKVTVFGSLEGQTWSGAWYPLADKKVLIYHHVNGTADTLAATTRTAADGTYRVVVTVPSSGQWRAAAFLYYSGNSPAYATASAPTGWFHAAYKMSFDRFDVTPEPVGIGTPVTARGMLLRTEADGSTRIVREPRVVQLWYSPDGTTWSMKASTKTYDTGWFEVRATAPGDGYWKVVYPGGAPYPYHTPELRAESGRDWVDARWRTALSANAAPEPVRYGRALTVSGKLQRYTTSWSGLGGQRVYVYTVPRGETRASYAGYCVTNAYGYYKCSFTAARDGHWYVRYTGNASYMAKTSAPRLRRRDLNARCGRKAR
ncbi:MAG: hypothetical protein ACRDT6_28040 [Micromonosporaceae bacterium]